MVTASGGSLLVAGCGLAVATFLTGYPQLAALALVCLVTVAFAFLSTPRPPVEVSATWTSPRIVDGDSAVLTLIARNPGRRRSRETLVTTVSAATGATFKVVARAAGERVHRSEGTVPELAGGQLHPLNSGATSFSRGVYRFEELVSLDTDVLGVFRRERRIPCDLTLLVQPRTAPLRPASRRPVEEGSRVSAWNRSGGESFHALREYQPGDETRHIHWLATARTGTVMIREFSVSESTGQTVVLDTSAEVYGPGPLNADPGEDASLDVGAFEVAVRVAASLAVEAVRQGDLQLLTTAGLEHHYRTGTGRDDVLDTLAAVVTGPASLGSVRTAVRSLATELTVVTGPATDLGFWRVVAGRRPLTIVLISDHLPPARANGPVRMLSVSSLKDFSDRWDAPWRG